MIVGGRVNEGLPGIARPHPRLRRPDRPLRWTFHTIPHPGEFGYETWPKDAWTYNGGANNWAGMALDETPRHRVRADRLGGGRLLRRQPHRRQSLRQLAACAQCRDRQAIWHFQIVRHDISDRDLPSPPNLVTLRRNGGPIDAVAQTTKHGYLFVFDRANGKPVFPIEYRQVPGERRPGEVAADTQPIPTRPAPFARQVLTQDMLTTRTPEARKWALEDVPPIPEQRAVRPARRVGQQTIVFPGFDGGAEWGGAAFDPETGLSTSTPTTSRGRGSLAPDDAGHERPGAVPERLATCHRDDLAGTPPQIPSLVGIGERKVARRADRRHPQGRAAGCPRSRNLQPFAVNAHRRNTC